MRAEIGGMPLQAGEPRGLLADPASSEGGRDSVSPQALCRHTALRTPTPRPGPRDCERLHLRGLSGLGCGPSRGSARTQTWTDRPKDAAVSTGGSPAPWSGRARVQLQTDQQLGPAGPARLPSIPPCTGTPAPPGTCSPRLLHVLTLQKTLIFAGRPGDQERLAACVTCLARGRVPSMSSFTCNSFGLKEPGVLVWAVCPGFGHLGRDAAAFTLLPSPGPPPCLQPGPHWPLQPSRAPNPASGPTTVLGTRPREGGPGPGRGVTVLHALAARKAPRGGGSSCRGSSRAAQAAGV